MTNITPDIIGRIPSALPTYDAEGNQLTPVKWLDGYHVNTPEPVPEWADYLLDPQPATPVRVYAGGIMPACYKFPDKATFMEVYPGEAGTDESTDL